MEHISLFLSLTSLMLHYLNIHISSTSDDTSVYSSHNRSNHIEIQKSFHNDLNSILDYGKRWNIKFNSTKTVMQTFTTKHDTHSLQLTFSNQPVPKVIEHKHLGLFLSTDLRFHAHTSDVIFKVNKALSPLHPISKHLPRTILDQLYKIYI